VVHVELVSPVVFTQPASQTVVGPWYVVTSAQSPVPTSAHRAAGLARTGATTATVRKTADVRVIRAGNPVCGPASISNALVSVMSPAIGHVVINLVPDNCPAVICVLESVEKLVRPSAECATVMR